MPGDQNTVFPTFAHPQIVEGREMAGGMSLRDWFAGQALAGLLASWSMADDIRFVRMSYADRMKMFAFNSYMQADAMLAERSNP